MLRFALRVPDPPHDVAHLLDADALTEQQRRPSPLAALPSIGFFGLLEDALQLLAHRLILGLTQHRIGAGMGAQLRRVYDQVAQAFHPQAGCQHKERRKDLLHRLGLLKTRGAEGVVTRRIAAGQKQVGQTLLAQLLEPTRGTHPSGIAVDEDFEAQARVVRRLAAPGQPRRWRHRLVD